MAAHKMKSFEACSRRNSCVFRLPEPYKTPYFILPFGLFGGAKDAFFFYTPPNNENSKQQKNGQRHPLQDPWQSGGFSFSELKSNPASDTPPPSNNTPWARAVRSPVIEVTSLARDDEDAPAALVWALTAVVFTICPELELFRLEITGDQSHILAQTLTGNGLASAHPEPSAPPGQPVPLSQSHLGQLVVHRASFWQGAGSPFGPRPIWLPSQPNKEVTETPRSRFGFPPDPLNYTFSTKFSSAWAHARHPIRPPKPRPGSLIYSRYIPHLDEIFSMIAVDFTNEEHLHYFHTWQNHPRVAQGWNEAGTVDEHRAYLRKIHEDPHQFAVLGLFDGTPFAYFEVYWAKEDHMGAYYDAGEYDRGRHFLVGDERFRGPHRVKAWHTSLSHYMFLDDPRTNFVVGEPRATGAKVLAYDQENGYYIDKFIDLPHKRAALVKSSRERFFQLMPFDGLGDSK